MTPGQHIASAIGGLVIAFGLAYPTLDRGYPIHIDALAVLSPTVEVGHDVLMSVQLDRAKVCPTTAAVTLFDGAGIEWHYADDERQAFGPEGQDYKIVRHTVPPGATAGTARIRVTLTFECNWTQRFWPLTMVLPDQAFTILPEQPVAP